MPTKAELEQTIARDLARKDLDSVTLAQIRDALINADASIQQAIRSAVRQRSTRGIGTAVLRAVEDHLATLALPEAQAMLANDTLDLTELSRWLD